MQIHNWIVAALVRVDHRICVQAHNEVVAQFAGLLQKVQMAHVEEIKGASYIDLKNSWMLGLLVTGTISLRELTILSPGLGDLPSLNCMIFWVVGKN